MVLQDLGFQGCECYREGWVVAFPSLLFVVLLLSFTLAIVLVLRELWRPLLLSYRSSFVVVSQCVPREYLQSCQPMSG